MFISNKKTEYKTSETVIIAQVLYDAALIILSVGSFWYANTVFVKTFLALINRFFFHWCFWVLLEGIDYISFWSPVRPVNLLERYWNVTLIICDIVLQDEKVFT